METEQGWEGFDRRIKCGEIKGIRKQLLEEGRKNCEEFRSKYIHNLNSGLLALNLR